jgi:hypothetical protein
MAREKRKPKKDPRIALINKELDRVALESQKEKAHAAACVKALADAGIEPGQLGAVVDAAKSLYDNIGMWTDRHEDGVSGRNVDTAMKGWESAYFKGGVIR